MLLNNAVSAGVGFVPIIGEKYFIMVASCRALPADFRTFVTLQVISCLRYVTGFSIESCTQHCMSGPVQVYKSNSRNAALLEEYLRIRGEEFLRASSQRQEDPEEVRPGAGLSVNNGIPGSSGASITQNTRKGKTVTGVDRKKA